jgi:hypothetical protein
MAGTLSPERISATPILQMKNTDTGWSTTVGLDLGIDLTLKINMGVQLRHTLQGGASSVAATQGGLYLSYRPGS